MRAGPSNDFPIVTTVYDGSVVHVHGCVRGYTWCDVSWHGDRGWVYADYLTYRYHDRYVPIIEYGDEIDLPIVTFSIGNYWDDYYRGRPWFHNREHWRSVWSREDHNFRDHRGRPHEREGRNVEHGNRGDHEANREEHRGEHRGNREDHNRGDHRADRNNDFPTGSIGHGGGDHGGRGGEGRDHGGGDHGGRGGEATEHGGDDHGGRGGEAGNDHGGGMGPQGGGGRGGDRDR
jgi:uncharacterized protein YraI